MRASEMASVSVAASGCLGSDGSAVAKAVPRSPARRKNSGADSLAYL